MHVYVDTSALIALAHKRDALHDQAVLVYQRLLEQNTRFLTTSAVLLEVGNTFSGASHKVYATSLFHLIQNSSTWEMLFIDEAWFTKGLDLFHHRMDKDWSLVDCISMVVSKSYSINKVFTSDHHFRQASFEILL